MRVVVIVDRAFGRAEAAMLARLQIGLADEGHRVVHAAPVATIATEQSAVYSTTVGYVDTGLPFTLRSRVAVLVETLKALAEKQGDRGPVHVVHALGGRTWPAAIELSRQTGSAMVIELDRASLLPASGTLAREPEPSGRGDAAPVPLFSVPDDRLRIELLRRSPRARVCVARWGVHVPAYRHARSGAPALALLVERGDSRSAIAVLEALAGIVRDAPDLMVFVDIVDGRTASVWRAARKLGLLERLSMVPEMEARRDPVLQMDALLLPDAAGASHSLSLDAMAAGMAVIASPDALNETLIDGKTARLVAVPTKTDWERAIREAVLDGERWSLLGASSREYIGINRPVSGHIGSVIAAYHQAQRFHESDRSLPVAAA